LFTQILTKDEVVAASTTTLTKVIEKILLMKITCPHDNQFLKYTFTLRLKIECQKAQTMGNKLQKSAVLIVVLNFLVT
jgi:hypothetical protein